MYADRTASKFPQGLAGFPPALMQGGASPQPAQWKASTRAANPSSAANLAAPPPSASTSVKNQIPLQQQARSQQPPPHQAHQISFGVSPAKVPGPQAGNNTAAPAPATIAVGSPQNSVSKSSSGSPHSSAVAKSAPPPSPVLPVLPFQKQPSGKNSPSSTISPLTATNRNLPSILGNPQNLGGGSKPQPASQHLQQSQIPKQHPQQAQPAQLYFSYPYMQSQPSDAAAAASYFQQHRRLSDQRQNPAPASTGMLSLGPSSSLSLAASAAPDPSKAGVAGAGNSKNLMPHPAQFAAISQPGPAANPAAAHPLMYIHAMQSVPLKPDVSSSADQKPAAGR